MLNQHKKFCLSDKIIFVTRDSLLEQIYFVILQICFCSVPNFGCHLFNNLSWTLHLNYVISKVFKVLLFLCHSIFTHHWPSLSCISHLLDLKSRAYCNHLWHPQLTHDIYSLERNPMKQPNSFSMITPLTNTRHFQSFTHLPMARSQQHPVHHNIYQEIPQVHFNIFHYSQFITSFKCQIFPVQINLPHPFL